MSIASEITRIGTEVNTQTDLIAQIATALAGKAAAAGIETCTLSVNALANENISFVYTDENGAGTLYAHDESAFSGSLTVSKGVFAFSCLFNQTDINYMTTAGGVEVVSAKTTNPIFIITSDGSINIGY